MEDPFDILDCALRSRYVSLADLPKLPIWDRLPQELRSVLAVPLADGEPLGTVLRLTWTVRAQLLGKPPANESAERTRTRCRLRLGLMYLAFREGRMRAEELLTRAWRIADGYVCGLEGRPFVRALDERTGESVESVEGRLSELFAPYTAIAIASVEQWGMRGP